MIDPRPNSIAPNAFFARCHRDGKALQLRSSFQAGKGGGGGGGNRNRGPRFFARKNIYPTDRDE